MAEHKGFFLYLDQYAPIEDLTLEQKGKLLEAMFAYNSGLEAEIFDPEVKIAFKFFKQTFERDKQRYEDKCAKMRDNAAKKQMPADVTKSNQSHADATKSTQQQEQKQEQDKNKRQKTPPTPASGGDLPGEQPSLVLGNSARDLRAKVEAYTDSAELRAALEDFRVMRERIRKPLTQAALDLTIRDLDKFAGEDTARKVAIVQQSVQRGWQGIFQLKGDFQAQTNGPDDMEAAMERVRQRNERLKAAERGEVA